MLRSAPHPPAAAPRRYLNGRFTLSPTPPPENVLTAKLPPLYHLSLGCRLAQLYARCFPNDPSWRTLVPDWRDEAAVIKEVQTFLEKVSSELFPVVEGYGWEGDVREVEWPLYNIPLMVYGFDLWYEDLEGYKEPVPLLHHLCNVRGSAYCEDDGEYDDLTLPRTLEPIRLVDTLKTMPLPQPLDALPYLIQMMESSTGNIFLDVGDIGLHDSQGHPYWEADNIAWLIEAWQAAKPVMGKLEAVWAWEAKDGEKITAVCETLLTAYAQKEVLRDPAIS